MFKTKIDILGTTWKVEFLESEKYEKVVNARDKLNELGTKTTGSTFHKDKRIYVANVIYGDGEIIFEENVKTLWHEIGHAIDSTMTSSIIQGEWTAVAMEYMFKLQPQVRKIEREYIKKAKEYNGKIKT